MQGMRKLYPDAAVYIFLSDDAEDLVAKQDGDLYALMERRDIGIPHFNYMKFSCDIMEFSTSAKPFCIDYLFKRHLGATVVYMDSDIYPLSRFDELEELIENGANIVLAPHIDLRTEGGQRRYIAWLLENQVNFEEWGALYFGP